VSLRHLGSSGDSSISTRPSHVPMILARISGIPPAAIERREPRPVFFARRRATLIPPLPSNWHFGHLTAQPAAEIVTPPFAYPARALHLVEALAFSAFVGWYIWRLQLTRRDSWWVFVVWLVSSFLLRGDTPKTLGWRADNLWPTLRRAAAVFVPCIVAVCLIGIALGGLRRFPSHLFEARRFGGYAAFCLLQQVALNSYLTNRLLAALRSPLVASLLSGLIFAALHWPNPVLVPLTFIGGAADAAAVRPAREHLA